MVNTDFKNNENSQEHTLVCLSASPTNARIIKTAAKMASAFGGSFTALYVQTPESNELDEESRKRLQHHIKLAEEYNANITTVYGADVSFQIAEFARISGVTKIVIGNNNARRRHFWSKATLADRLIELVPNIDIHIIPDNTVETQYKVKTQFIIKNLIPYPKDIIITLALLIASTLVGVAFFNFGFTDANIIPVYILSVLLTSIFTRGYFCGIVGSLLSVILFNYYFTEPRLTLHAYDSRYAVTFAIMLAASIITGTLASKLKSHAKQSAQTAFRTKVLLDTNQLLQKASNTDDIINITATQLIKLLNRSVVFYSIKEDKLIKGSLFSTPTDNDVDELLLEMENQAAEWSFENKTIAGATTNSFPKAKCLYHPVGINNKCYGIVGIHIINKPLDSFETSILMSILGECALALDNNRNAKEKELAAVLAKNEQLRANLLRAISHDLRTPLTSISGNASNLMSNYDMLDEETRVQTFIDIFDDSQWLISLVENLLSVSRIEEGRMNINMSVHLMDEVIDEALHHINRQSAEHTIEVDYGSDLLLAKMDAKLIIQVIINLVDNAIKYTNPGSTISIQATKEEDNILVSVKDNGPGIPDTIKPHVFEMFYTGNNKIGDSRRSLGLGLSLCKSIISAHGGEISLTDNKPSGSVFSFYIPSSEVTINE